MCQYLLWVTLTAWGCNIMPRKSDKYDDYSNNTMTDFLLSKGLPHLINSLGEGTFFENLCVSLETLIGYDGTVFIAYPVDEVPYMVYDNIGDIYGEEATTNYFNNVAHTVDPFFQLIKKGAPEGVYDLHDIAPDEFFESEFYKRFYAATNLVSEIALIIRLPDGVALEVSVGLRDKAAKQGNEITTFAPFLNVFSSLIHKHYAQASIPAASLGTQLNDVLANFGKDYLSQRECDVLRLVLQGYSTKGIAELLDVSTETIKVYRKRIHSKLEISSQSELFSLFLEAAATMPPNSASDPLTHYFNG